MNNNEITTQRRRLFNELAAENNDNRRAVLLSKIKEMYINGQLFNVAEINMEEERERALFDTYMARQKELLRSFGFIIKPYKEGWLITHPSLNKDLYCPDNDPNKRINIYRALQFAINNLLDQNKCK